LAADLAFARVVDAGVDRRGVDARHGSRGVGVRRGVDARGVWRGVDERRVWRVVDARRGWCGGIAATLRGWRGAMTREQDEQEQASHHAPNARRWRWTYGMPVGHAPAMQTESHPSIPHG
jgi:hypothetical protein